MTCDDGVEPHEHGRSAARARRRDGVRGRRGRPPARRRRRRGRGRVQHRALGLPGDPHRPVVRGPGHHVHVPAHRQLRRSTATTTRPPRRTAAASSCAISRAARRTGAPPTTSTGSSNGTAVAGIAGIDTRRLTRHIRHAGAMPGAFGIADRDALLAAAQADGGTDGRDLVDAVSTADAVHRRPRRRAASSSSRTTSASSVRSSTNSSRPAARSKWCPRRRRRPTCSRASPTACSSRTVPAIPAAVAGARGERARRCSAKVPVFGICLGHQIMGLALGARHVQAAVRSPRRQPSGAPPRDRPRRDHEPEPQLRGRRRHAARRQRGVAPEPERRRRRRRRAPTCSARSACSTTRRPGPARTMPATCSREFTELMRSGLDDADAPPRRPRDDPAHRQRPDRHRAGVRVRLLRHPGVPRAARRGLPRRARRTRTRRRS